MKQALIALTALIMCGLAQASVSEEATRAAKNIATSELGIRWDPQTLVSGDLNADGHRDFAMVGYKDEGIVLAIRASSAKKHAYRNELQYFTIGSSVQAAICEAPARLSVVKQVCSSIDGSHPGCRPSKVAKALNLSGGECDSIHLFWNHKTNRMEWWRQ